jgi:hypothetical protein
MKEGQVEVARPEKREWTVPGNSPRTTRIPVVNADYCEWVEAALEQAEKERDELSDDRDEWIQKYEAMVDARVEAGFVAHAAEARLSKVRGAAQEFITLLRAETDYGDGPTILSNCSLETLDSLDRLLSILDTDPNEGDPIRDEAVRNVDQRHGHTVEFSSSPEDHRLDYDEEEERLSANPEPVEPPEQERRAKRIREKAEAISRELTTNLGTTDDEAEEAVRPILNFADALGTQQRCPTCASTYPDVCKCAGAAHYHGVPTRCKPCPDPFHTDSKEKP